VDYFGNDTHHFEIGVEHDRLEVTSTSNVEVRAPSEIEPERTWEQVALQVKSDREFVSVREFCFDSPLVRSHRSLREYAESSFTAGRPLTDAVVELNERIHTDFKYEPAATDVSTPLAQVMRDRRGVCQDFAQVAVGCLRSMGLPGRYVSGYLETQPPPGQTKLVGADASHAWASAYMGPKTWLDFDPTNNALPSDQHVTVAWGRDFSDVSPLRGVVLAGGSHRITVGVDVQRHADPRRPPSVAPAKA
jgi:transglutaminase-like putative cysteine protease